MTEPETNVRRVYQTYLYATCFVTIVIALLAAASAINSLVDIVAPGLKHGGGDSLDEFVRRAATGGFITAIIFGGIAFAVFAWHWKLAEGVRAELAAAGTSLPSIADPSNDS